MTGETESHLRNLHSQCRRVQMIYFLQIHSFTHIYFQKVIYIIFLKYSPQTTYNSIFYYMHKVNLSILNRELSFIPLKRIKAIVNNS